MFCFPIHYNPLTSDVALLVLWPLIMIASFLISPVCAADQPAVLNNNGTIRISADTLTVPSGPEKQAVFSGNVRAEGDRFHITADQLHIFYGPVPDTTEAEIADENTLEKIIATGNVVITSGEKIAKTQEAVYDREQQTIILSGKESVVRQNNSYISGARIIMHTDSEAVTVESDNGKRVEAFIEAREIKNND